MPRPSRPRDPDEAYSIVICRRCQHPGGAHVIDQWEPRLTHCRYCPACPAYEDGATVRWTDRMSREAEAQMAENQILPPEPASQHEGHGGRT